MKRVNKMWAVLGMAVMLGVSAGSALAQEQPQRQRGGDRGNFDPAEMQKRMMDRYREQLEIKGDDEWKVIEPRIAKVWEARREASMGGGFGGFGRGGRGGGGGGGGGNDQAGGTTRPRPGGEAAPEADALQKAIEAKAPAEEIKGKLAKYREAKKGKEANLTKAQDELKKVLSLRQEATAVMAGLLQ